MEFLDEHGPRHFMDPSSASLGFTADQREFLGSRPLGPTFEYACTQCVVVERQQFAVARAIRESHAKRDLMDKAAL